MDMSPHSIIRLLSPSHTIRCNCDLVLEAFAKTVHIYIYRYVHVNTSNLKTFIGGPKSDGNNEIKHFEGWCAFLWEERQLFTETSSNLLAIVDDLKPI